MKEIIEALNSRVRSPLFGYFVLAFIFINWRALLLLWLADEDIEMRIELFCFYTNYSSLLLYPALFAVFGAVAYPWINLFFLRLAHKPAIHKNSLQITTDHERLMQQTKLESLRNNMFAKKEEGLIEQAKRDQEVQSIEDDKLRKRLEKEIESLRKERDDLKNAGNTKLSVSQLKSINPQHSEFQKYVDSGKLDDFIANREIFLTQSVFSTKNIKGSSNAMAFGLIDKAGVNATLSKKGREFFEWWILNEG